MAHCNNQISLLFKSYSFGFGSASKGGLGAGVSLGNTPVSNSSFPTAFGCKRKASRLEPFLVFPALHKLGVDQGLDRRNKPLDRLPHTQCGEGFLRRSRPFLRRLRGLNPATMVTCDNTSEALPFWNQCFDKNRLKNFVLWFLVTYGEYRTVNLIEQLKNIGFEYATKAGISLGIDDLKIPPKKSFLLLEADKLTNSALNQYNRGEITGVERFQKMIDTWHRTSEILKQEVIDNFELTDTLNPVYMMAFSGARGNISQVRQLVGMRGLMANPQGQILDFPIRSNFREGLSLTEYIISTYGARKGIVDTALRTANAGYLTRRLVDVAQHVIVSNFDCGTDKGIFLNDMKEGNKVLYSLQNRLIGRVLGKNICSVAVNSFREVNSFWGVNPLRSSGYATVNPQSELLQRAPVFLRNTEISIDLAMKLCKISNKIFVRSTLTCETQKTVCQLCYGWSLSQGNLVSIGEAVGVVAAQSVGEPGTQLTMRTFHTGGVFTGDITDQIKAPYNGFAKYLEPIAGTLIRTPEGKIAFLTKTVGFIEVISHVSKPPMIQRFPHLSGVLRSNTLEKRKEGFEKSKIYKIPAYTLLFVRHGENIFYKQVIAQIANISLVPSSPKALSSDPSQNASVVLPTQAPRSPGLLTVIEAPPSGVKGLDKALQKSSSFLRGQQDKRDDAEFTINSEMEGEFYSVNLNLLEKNSSIFIAGVSKTPFGESDEDTLDNLQHASDQVEREVRIEEETVLEAGDWGYAWILSGKVYQLPVLSMCFPQPGDFLNRKSLMNQIQLKVTNEGGNIGFLDTQCGSNDLILNKPVLFLEINKIIYKKIGYLFTLPEYCFLPAGLLHSVITEATLLSFLLPPFLKRKGTIALSTQNVDNDVDGRGSVSRGDTQGASIAVRSLVYHPVIPHTQCGVSQGDIPGDRAAQTEKSNFISSFPVHQQRRWALGNENKFVITYKDILFTPTSFLPLAQFSGSKAKGFKHNSIKQKASFTNRREKFQKPKTGSMNSVGLNLSNRVDSRWHGSKTKLKNSSANWSQNLSLFLEWFPHSTINTGGIFLNDWKTLQSISYTPSMWSTTNLFFGVKGFSKTPNRGRLCRMKKPLYYNHEKHLSHQNILFKDKLTNLVWISRQYYEIPQERYCQEGSPRVSQGDTLPLAKLVGGRSLQAPPIVGPGAPLREGKSSQNRSKSQTVLRIASQFMSGTPSNYGFFSCYDKAQASFYKINRQGAKQPVIISQNSIFHKTRITNRRSYPKGGNSLNKNDLLNKNKITPRNGPRSPKKNLLAAIEGHAPLRGVKSNANFSFLSKINLLSYFPGWGTINVEKFGGNQISPSSNPWSTNAAQSNYRFAINSRKSIQKYHKELRKGLWPLRSRKVTPFRLTRMKILRASRHYGVGVSCMAPQWVTRDTSGRCGLFLGGPFIALRYQIFKIARHSRIVLYSHHLTPLCGASIAKEGPSYSDQESCTQRGHALRSPGPRSPEEAPSIEGLLTVIEAPPRGVNNSIAITLKKGWLYFPFRHSSSGGPRSPAGTSSFAGYCEAIPKFSPLRSIRRAAYAAPQLMYHEVIREKKLSKRNKFFINLQAEKKHQSLISPGQFFIHDLLFDNNTYVEWVLLHSSLFPRPSIAVRRPSYGDRGPVPVRKKSFLKISKAEPAQPNFPQRLGWVNPTKRGPDHRPSSLLWQARPTLWVKSNRCRFFSKLSEKPISRYSNLRETCKNPLDDTEGRGSSCDRGSFAIGVRLLKTKTSHAILIQKAFELTTHPTIDYKNAIAELYKSNSDFVITESKDFLISGLRGKGLVNVNAGSYWQDQSRVGNRPSISVRRLPHTQCGEVDREPAIGEAPRAPKKARRPSIAIEAQSFSKKRNQPSQNQVSQVNCGAIIDTPRRQISFFSKKIYLWRSIFPQNSSESGVAMPNTPTCHNVATLLKKPNPLSGSRSAQKDLLTAIEGHTQHSGINRVRFIKLRKNKSYNSLFVKRQLHWSLLNKQKKSFTPLLTNWPIPYLDFKVKRDLIALPTQNLGNHSDRGAQQTVAYPLLQRRRKLTHFVPQRGVVAKQKRISKAKSHTSGKESFMSKNTNNLKKTGALEQGIRTIIFKKPVNTSPLLIGYNLPYGSDHDFNIPNVHLNAKRHPPGVQKTFFGSAKRSLREVSQYQMIGRPLAYTFAQPCFSFCLSKKLPTSIRPYKANLPFFTKFKKKGAVPFNPRCGVEASIRKGDPKKQEDPLYLTSQKENAKLQLFFNLYSTGASLYDNKFISSNPFIKSSYLSAFEGEFLKEMSFAAPSLVHNFGWNPSSAGLLSGDREPVLLHEDPSFALPLQREGLEGDGTTTLGSSVKQPEGGCIILTKSNLICFSFSSLCRPRSIARRPAIEGHAPRSGANGCIPTSWVNSIQINQNTVGLGSPLDFKSTRDNISKEMCNFFKLDNIVISPPEPPHQSTPQISSTETVVGDKSFSWSPAPSISYPLHRPSIVARRAFFGDRSPSISKEGQKALKGVRGPRRGYSRKGWSHKVGLIPKRGYATLNSTPSTEKALLTTNTGGKESTKIGSLPYKPFGEVKGLITGFQKGRGRSLFKNILSLGEFFVYGDKIIPHARGLSVNSVLAFFNPLHSSEYAPLRGVNPFCEYALRSPGPRSPEEAFPTHSVGKAIEGLLTTIEAPQSGVNYLAPFEEHILEDTEEGDRNDFQLVQQVNCGAMRDASLEGVAIPTSGQIIHIGINKMSLRRAQPIFISPKSILHVADGSFIFNNVPVMTLTYQRLKTGDIVQGIPKVEQYLEARITKQGRLFRDCLPNLLKGLFQRYRSQLPLERAVRQSFYKIQQIIVDGVLRVYRSQGVTIADKHLEVIVKQMTSKVKIINGAQTGFFPGEIIDLHFLEKVNLSLMKKIQYEPLILGITRAALEVDSFLSAASFQQTTRVLSSAAIAKRKDFLKGLKENILLGNLMPAGTGYLVYLEDISFSNEKKGK